MMSAIPGMVLLLCLMACPLTAEAWWNEDWQYRKKISFDTTPMGADIKENLSEVPILLRLHSGNFNFVNAREDGTDIRFVSSDETVLLKYHIETYDTIDEIALLWVKLPRLSGGSNQDYIWMYYGNAAAVGGQEAAGSYDVNQVLVYHLGEIDQPPRDATAYENQAASFQGGQGLPSIIGQGVMLNGSGESIQIAASPSLEDFSGGFSFSAWVRIAQPQPDTYLFARQDDVRSIVIGVDETKVYCRVIIFGEDGENLEEVTEKVADLGLDNWHYVSVVISPQGRLAIYLDDLEITWKQLAEPFVQPGGDILIGASPDGEHSFVGDLDELGLARIGRSKDWNRLMFKNQAPGSQFGSFSMEEVYEGGGLPTFYLGTVVKNITLDGLFIIFILIAFAVASWLIFMARAYMLYMMQKEDKAFMETFNEQPDLFAMSRFEEDFPNAPLYRIYAAGCREIKDWTGKPDNTADNAAGSRIMEKGLSRKGLNAVKGALEKALILETQALNAWLVLLTMAITGGPFLGLLGTVWGVMNTFAAMAEAGEANIMAIAPGVASALSTTVFGLIVAIPALFGYNYLTSQIKKITVDLNVFVDDFAQNIDETYGADK